jgi:Tol biopolymer transport system component
MKVTQLLRRLAATPSLVAVFSLATFCATNSQAEEHALRGSVLFYQSHENSSGTITDAIALFRAPAAGGASTQLTPVTVGTLDIGARWFGHGRNVVFERVNPNYTASQLYRMDRNGNHLRQITVGSEMHQNPAVGPDHWVAYLDGGFQQNDCLALVKTNGDDQHILFCPQPADATIATPQWSSDGKSIFLDVNWTDWAQGGLDPPQWSDVYKVDVATGKATWIFHWYEGDYPSDFVVSPDGTRAVLRWYNSAMVIADFVTNTGIGSEAGPLYGAGPTWSPDSKHIAYAQNVYIPGSGVEQFGAIFVMDNDGTHPRQITTHLVADEYFWPVQWSNDGSHILLNRVQYFVNGVHSYAEQSVNMLELCNQKITTVTASGLADRDAWEQYP